MQATPLTCARFPQQIYAERLAINGFYANGVRAIVQDGNVVLVRCLCRSGDVVLVGERVVEVIEHHEDGLFALFARHFFDLLRDSVARDDIKIICGNFANSGLCILYRKELGVVSER